MARDEEIKKAQTDSGSAGGHGLHEFQEIHEIQGLQELQELHGLQELQELHGLQEPSMPFPIVFFDGVCNFCNSSVQFILRRDPTGRFRFAALQSETARRLLAEPRNGIDPLRLDSIVLLEEGRCYTESTAALRIARRLRGWPRWAAPLLLVPRPLRDGVYRFVARHRYRWFGRQEACLLPSPDVRQRFLD